MSAGMQAELFGEAPVKGLARRTDPETAKAAARKAPAAGLQMRVLDALRRSREGLTSHELAALLGEDLVSVSPRLRPLANKGLVRDSGERRAGPSGTKSIVWVAGTDAVIATVKR